LQYICLTLEASLSKSSVNGSPVGLVVKSPSPINTPQVIPTSFNVVVTQSNTDNDEVTSATSQQLIHSQSITSTGMFTALLIGMQEF